MAIAEYELTRGVLVHHCGAAQQTLVHPVLDFLAATPDGFTADRVVETKAPWRALYTSIDERPDYAAQLQLQIEVSGLDRADLVIWRQGQIELVMNCCPAGSETAAFLPLFASRQDGLTSGHDCRRPCTRAHSVGFDHVHA